MTPERRTLLLLIGAFCLPIKLSFAYIVFIPLILHWLIGWYRGENSLFGACPTISTPLIFYFIAVGLSSLFGLNPLKSLINSSNAFFMAFLIPVYSSVRTEKEALSVLGMLIAGQTIAAVDSIGERINWGFAGNFLVGEVTESGQLALIIPALFGLLRYLSISAKSQDTAHALMSSEHRQDLAASCTVILLLTCCFSNTLNLSSATQCAVRLLTVALFLFVLLFILNQRKKNSGLACRMFSPLLLISLPLTLTTMVANLKRGPWAGVSIGLLLYFFTYRPRAIIPVLAIALFSVCAITPVRERLLSSREHFFIAGGRSEIWDIGKELAITYPTGIGFRNSSVLGKFSTDIPPNLKHFHSNPINIMVESGALGFLLFYWWIIRCLAQALRARLPNNQHHPITIGIGCSLIAWQMAGLVEFNVGDSEVLYVAYLLVGVLAAFIAQSKQALTTPAPS